MSLSIQEDEPLLATAYWQADLDGAIVDESRDELPGDDSATWIGIVAVVGSGIVSANLIWWAVSALSS